MAVIRILVGGTERAACIYYPLSLVSDGRKLGDLLGPLLRRIMSVKIAGEARPVSGGGDLESGGIAICQFEPIGL